MKSYQNKNTFIYLFLGYRKSNWQESGDRLSIKYKKSKFKWQRGIKIGRLQYEIHVFFFLKHTKR